MSSSYDSERVSFLAAEILRHKKLYYAGQPIISDFDFDRLEEELKALSPSHPVLSYVGAEPSASTNAKVSHRAPMLSLSKTYDLKDLLSWVGDEEVMGSLKVDGSSVALVYQDGRLQLAKTRGNGREGEDVTAKIRWVSDVVPAISDREDIEIRGELYCTESQFIKLAEEMQRRGLERPFSPRNIVAGVLGRKIHADLAAYFNFFAFEVLGKSTFKTEVQKVDWLDAMKFRLPNARLLKTHADVSEYLSYVKSIMAEGEIGIDGAVFSYNRLSLHEELGNTSHHPRYKNSFKWQGETARSKILRIDWATSRLGIVTPVAVIEPVVLSGATITNVTLHNAAHVRTYNLKAGDTIEIVRSGEVIPKFLAVVDAGRGDVILPTRCPSCETALIFDDVRLKCPNHGQCPAQLSGAILNWINAVGIDDISEKRLQLMISKGLVRRVPDLYQLTLNDLLTLPATKEKMAAKLLQNIQGSKVLPLARFLHGLGIEGAGLTTWDKIVSQHPSLSKIRSLKSEEIVLVDGFAEKSANQIVDGLRVNSELIADLLKVGVQPQDVSIVRPTSDKLRGMQFVITGELSRPRKEIEELIKSASGKVSTSVSKNTNVLICNEQDSGSSKMNKAKELGLPIWTEEVLMKKLL